MERSRNTIVCATRTRSQEDEIADHLLASGRASHLDILTCPLPCARCVPSGPANGRNLRGQ